jgi:hypothetical protein
LASPEDTFDFDRDEDSLDELEQGSPVRRSVLAMNDPVLRAARRELRWFHTEMKGRVPSAFEAPADEVAAGSRIAGWLSQLEPRHRGAFVLRYNGKRWPARITREFGGLTGVVVRCAAMQRQRGPTETLVEAERAAVVELLTDIAAAAGHRMLRGARKSRRIAPRSSVACSVRRGTTCGRRSSPTSMRAAARGAPFLPVRAIRAVRRGAHEDRAMCTDLLARSDARPKPDRRRGAPVVLPHRGRRYVLLELRADALARDRGRRVADARRTCRRRAQTPHHPVASEEPPRRRRGRPSVRVRSSAVAGRARQGPRATDRRRRATVVRPRDMARGARPAACSRRRERREAPHCAPHGRRSGTSRPP